jgi:hypothetical protein
LLTQARPCSFPDEICLEFRYCSGEMKGELSPK